MYSPEKRVGLDPQKMRFNQKPPFARSMKIAQKKILNATLYGCNRERIVLMRHQCLSFCHVVCLSAGFLIMINAAGASDSIVGWTTPETVVSDGRTTVSSGKVQPIYIALDIGKYIIIDGRRYVASGEHRFVLQAHTPSVHGTAEDTSDSSHHYRSKKHHRHKKSQKAPEDGNRINAERNASLTHSQKIYRDLKKKSNPALFEK